MSNVLGNGVADTVMTVAKPGGIDALLGGDVCSVLRGCHAITLGIEHADFQLVAARVEAMPTADVHFGHRVLIYVTADACGQFCDACRMYGRPGPKAAAEMERMSRSRYIPRAGILGRSQAGAVTQRPRLAA